MKRYLLKKALILISSLFIVTTLTFFLMHAIPGDPFTQEQAMPEEIMQALKRYYGLDRPLPEQYLRFLKGLMHGDLGPSFKYEGQSVNKIIADGFPISLTLGLEALFFAIPLGITLGTISACFRGRIQDRSCMLIAVLGISIPSFILATLLQFFFAMKFDLLPVARWGTFAQSILPAVSLAAMPTAFIARMTRANLLEVLEQDYILTARAKGLKSYRIYIRHGLRNALVPVITYLGPLTATIFTGSFAVEKIFGIPGLGQWFVMSITNRDYTVIMGTTLFYSALLMFCVFIVDMLYCVIDPRIERESIAHG